MSKESFKALPSQRFGHVFGLDSQSIPRVFVVCDQRTTAPVWSYILSQQGLTVTLETSLENAVDHWCTEMPEVGVIDISGEGQDLITLCKKFRAVSGSPLLLFLPAFDEEQILDSYAAGVDEVVVKPVSPAIFLAKVLSWLRRSNHAPLDEESLDNESTYHLNAARRCLMDPTGHEIKLTNLEFRLLTILMSHIGHVFSVEDVIRAIWGRYRPDDQILLANVAYRLRKKIETDPSHPCHLQRWHGGYSFHP
jgi:DNA-binding response OmpR family regulator